MSSADFRLEIGETLCKIKPNIKHRSIESEILAKKKIKGRRNMFPTLGRKRVRKFLKCTGVSPIILRKMRSSVMLQRTK